MDTEEEVKEQLLTILEAAKEFGLTDDGVRKAKFKRQASIKREVRTHLGSTRGYGSLPQNGEDGAT